MQTNKENDSNVQVFPIFEIDSKSLRQSLLNAPTKKQNLSSILFTQINKIINLKILNLTYLVDALNQERFLPYELTDQAIYETTQDISQLLKKEFKTTFFLIGLLKLLTVILTFTIPVIVDRLQLNEEYFIYKALALFITTCLATFADSQYTFNIKKMEIKSQSIIVNLIYDALDSKSDLEIINIIDIDVNTIINFYISFHEFWSLILKLIIGLTILYLKIKHALFFGFGAAVILMIINFTIAKQIGNNYGQAMVFKDQRMSLLKEFTSNPKAVKFLCWEEKMMKKISDIREKEYKALKKLKLLDSLCVLIWAVTNTIITTVTLYIYSQNQNLSNVFVIIYLFSLLTNPLNSLPWTFSGILSAKTSFLRINDFLKLKPVVEYSDELQIKDAVFKWPNNQFKISIKNFQISNLTYIIGPTRSGKSSYLQALLNQMKLTSGVAQLPSIFSYVPQNNWIFQGSIRDNIILNQQYDEQQFQKAINLSVFKDDISQFEDKELFDVGPEGQKLSGGQKQRLQIARAIYNEKDIYLLDDIFSSLDPQVADQIFHNLTLIKKPKIVVLNDSLLERYINYSDQIILMQDGEAIYDNKVIQNYVKNYKSNEVRKSHQTQIQGEKLEVQPQALDVDQINSGSFKLYIKNVGYFNLVWIILSLILMQASFNFYDIWINSYVNEDTIFFIQNSFIITLLGITLIDLLVKISRAISFAVGNLVQARKIFGQLLEKVVYASAKFFDNEEPGQILTRFSNDQNVVDNNFPFKLNILCNNVANFIGTFATIIYLQWTMSFAITIAFFLFYYIYKKYRPTSLGIRKIDAQSHSKLISCIYEQYKGIEIIKAYGYRDTFYSIFLENLRGKLTISWTNFTLQLWLQIRLQSVACFIVMSLLIFTYLSINYDFNISKSTLQLLLYYSLTKIGLFSDLTRTLVECEQDLISYQRINQYNNIEQENTNEILDKYYDLEFKDVSLSYQNAKQSLKKINLRITKGSKVAFCGRTGSGKSSIISVLFQLYKQTEGQVYLFENSLDKWRQRIGVIPQSGFVLKGSIEENLDCQDQEKIYSYVGDIKSVNPQTISQGTRQLISFARVMLKDYDVICLDEATASVDQKIEEFIQKELKNCNKTVITISHRLETLKNYDVIYYLEDGQIKEMGNFDELVKLNGGFSRLRNK